MNGFKEFLLRGNLIELAVAFIMGAAFATVVESFTKLLINLIGLIVNVRGLADLTLGGVNVGGFITALVTFLLTAAVVYIFIVVPYNRITALRVLRKKEEAKVVVPTEALLVEIRDLLRQRV